MLELREFVDLLALTDTTFKITSSEWDHIEEMRDVLYDCALFTKRIQAVQTTLSDFYAEWTQLKLKLKSKQQTNFVTTLIECMDERGEDLLTDPLTLSALFLDARYRVLLNKTPLRKQLAMNHLTLLWKRIQNIQDIQPDPLQTDNGENPTVRPNIDINDAFDDYLDLLESAATTDSIQALKSEELMMKLQRFNVMMEKKRREPSKRHPMDFWEENKHLYPEIHLLAQLVFAVCPTETSVERNFSRLYVLNKYRCNLSDKMLENILFIRLNKDLFDEQIRQPK